MSLKSKIENDIKSAMRAKDKDRLRALRSIKSLILLEETKDGNGGEITEDIEIQMLSKAAKQRRDSAEIYKQQDRADLAAVEEGELAIIEEYLPKQLSEEEITAQVKVIIEELGANSMKDMGKVMGKANQKMAGQADGKVISGIVKSILS